MSKLVRDKIPLLIQQGDRPRRLTVWREQDRVRWLTLKLQEEVKEFLDSRCVEELADILEVVLALAELQGISAEQLESARHAKAVNRGQFKQGWILHED